MWVFWLFWPCYAWWLLKTSTVKTTSPARLCTSFLSSRGPIETLPCLNGLSQFPVTLISFDFVYSSSNPQIKSNKIQKDKFKIKWRKGTFKKSRKSQKSKKLVKKQGKFFDFFIEQKCSVNHVQESRGGVPWALQRTKEIHTYGKACV